MRRLRVTLIDRGKTSAGLLAGAFFYYFCVMGAPAGFLVWRQNYGALGQRIGFHRGDTGRALSLHDCRVLARGQSCDERGFFIARWRESRGLGLDRRLVRAPIVVRRELRSVLVEELERGIWQRPGDSE